MTQLYFDFYEFDPFIRSLERASKLVASWPLWKQNILVNSASPTVRVPRKPINARNSEVD